MTTSIRMIFDHLVIKKVYSQLHYLCQHKIHISATKRWYCCWGTNYRVTTTLIHYYFIVVVKACVCYFLSNFDCFTKWSPFKNYEKRFLFYLKNSFHSWDIQIFVNFSLPFHTFQIQKDKWKWNNLWCHELACINLQM